MSDSSFFPTTSLINGAALTSGALNVQISAVQGSLNTVSGYGVYQLLGSAHGLDLSTGLNADLASISIASRRYYGVTLHVIANTAAGSLGLAALGVYTQPGGLGTTVITPTVQSTLTAAGLVQQTPSVAANVLTGAQLYIRSTAVSLNSSNCDVYLVGYNMYGV